MSDLTAAAKDVADTHAEVARLEAEVVANEERTVATKAALEGAKIQHTEAKARLMAVALGVDGDRV